jgi:hypothetical protein
MVLPRANADYIIVFYVLADELCLPFYPQVVSIAVDLLMAQGAMITFWTWVMLSSSFSSSNMVLYGGMLIFDFY